MLFGKPDKIPFQPGGPRESTLKEWHQQGLPERADWFRHLCETIGIRHDPAEPDRTAPGVSFIMIPEFEQKIIERRAGTLVVHDWKGNICEISDEFNPSYLGGKNGKIDFVTRRWIKCPVENRDDWEQMKKRYDPRGPAGRFPADFEDRCKKLRDRKHVCAIYFSGPFWQLREWCGFENLCIMMIEAPGFVEYSRLLAQLTGWL